jgi:4-diphosphocytidyl-2-C-methyl-D-erythritol kinase
MHVDVFAKVNLSLRVRPRDRSGRHPVRSLAQSIDWRDCVVLADGDEDSLDADRPDVPADEHNLAWRAAVAVRTAAGAAAPLRISLTKRIPVEAGLGGGSADAAGALVAAAERFRLDEEHRDALAPELGADVPFCLEGGTAWMEGHGERVTPIPFIGDYVLAVVVPPFPLSTAAVYRRWDELDGPTGATPPERDLPDSLRPHAPLGNDLVPAARDLSPALGEWMADLSRAWGRAVMMTGSGPAVFGYFREEDEAAGALGVAGDARAVRVCRPVDRGWEWDPSGTLP